MKTGKLCLAALLGAMPAIATAQPSVKVDVGVNLGIDTYDTVAPGDPVEAVDVFYDQLSPYGVWVDEPDAGRVFIPEVVDYVPYTRGHWEYTNLGFVWVSTEPFGWATSHYGRWAYSRYFGRWYWLPDTQWGPAWVEWRETGTSFGWAPLAPEIIVRAGWQPPVESWHYCSAEHVLDVNVVRYYEPRERVVEIHRQARPLQHYATVSNVKVVVGPPAARLREHRVTVHPVKVEARAVGRWTPSEARTQIERAREHRATFEVQNQRRIEARPQIHTAQVKVIEAHPQVKAQIDARVKATGRPEAAPAVPGRVEPARPAPGPERTEPGRRPEPERAQPGKRPAEPQRAQPGKRPEPQRTEPQRPEPQRTEPQRPEPQRAEPSRRPEPEHAQPGKRPAEPQRPEPQRAQPPRPEPQRAQPPRPEPQRAEPQRGEPSRRPEPPRAQPAQRPAEPPRGDRKEPDRKDPKGRDDDRKEPDKR